MGSLVEGIRISNRAQTLSFSLAHVALIRTAAQLATGVADRVSEAIGFDEILHQQPSEAGSDETSPTGPSLGDQVRELAEAIRSKLAKHAIEVNRGLRVIVQQDGRLGVGGDHPRVVEIESLLRADRTIDRLAAVVADEAGQPEIAIDLTTVGQPENMVAPGGYPNW